MYSLYLHTSFNLTLISWKFFVPQSTSIFNYFFDFESTQHIVIHKVKQKYISAILKIR